MEKINLQKITKFNTLGFLATRVKTKPLKIKQYLCRGYFFNWTRKLLNIQRDPNEITAPKRQNLPA